MATSREDLLRAVLRAPDDDAVRRVYGDLLSSEGDPRGELLQVQCDLAQLVEPENHEDVARRTALRRRELALTAQCTKEWLARFKPAIRSCTFSRGMIDHVSGPPRPLIDSLPRVFEHEPLESLRLRTVTVDNAAALTRAVGVERLRSLRISESRLGAKGAATLFDADRFGNLRSLDLYQAGLGDRGALTLAQSAVMARLESLVLSGNGLTREGLDQFCSSCSDLTKLRSLSLAWTVEGTRGAETFIRALTYSALESIDLACNRLQNEDLARVLAADSLRSIRRLRLEQNDLAGAGAIGALSPLTMLTDLDLSTNQLGEAGARALAVEAERWPLERLDLMQSSVGDAGIRALANVKLDRLRELDARYLGLSPAGAMALAEADWPLEHLDLWSNAIGNEGAAALSRARWRERVRVLVLAHNHIGDEGCIALSRSEWPRLERLVLFGNPIGEVGGKALGASKGFPALVELDLKQTQTTKRALGPLAKSLGVGVEV